MPAARNAALGLPPPNSNGDTVWDNSAPEYTDDWAKINDPSPAGWRIPTLNEIKRLIDDSKVEDEWISLNGIYGRRLTDIKSGNSIFLPAAGYIYPDNVSHGFINMGGFYWSSMYDRFTDGFAYMINFDELNQAHYAGYGCINGCSIRCVAEN